MRRHGSPQFVYLSELVWAVGFSLWSISFRGHTLLLTLTFFSLELTFREHPRINAKLLAPGHVQWHRPGHIFRKCLLCCIPCVKSNASVCLGSVTNGVFWHWATSCHVFNVGNPKVRGNHRLKSCPLGGSQRGLVTWNAEKSWWEPMSHKPIILMR